MRNISKNSSFPEYTALPWGPEHRWGPFGRALPEAEPLMQALKGQHHQGQVSAPSQVHVAWLLTLHLSGEMTRSVLTAPSVMPHFILSPSICPRLVPLSLDYIHSCSLPGASEVCSLMLFLVRAGLFPRKTCPGLYHVSGFLLKQTALKIFPQKYLSYHPRLGASNVCAVHMADSRPSQEPLHETSDKHMFSRTFFPTPRAALVAALG